MNDYAGALEYLYGLQLFGTKLGLNNIGRLLDLLGHPERGMDFYHVAGTNGKGSTVAFLEVLLRASGLKTGRFISPHLNDFRERIALDGLPVPPGEVAELTAEIKPLVAEVERTPDCTHPTFFEAVTALAVMVFARSGVEAVAWETGMGGRLDATSAVVPVVAAITALGLDHAAYLGKSLEEIAVEKAGIVKTGVPVVIGEISGRPRETIERICRERRSPLLEARGLFRASSVRPRRSGMIFDLETPWGRERDVEIPLYGVHQARNCETALAAWWTGTGGRFPGRSVLESLRRVQWPGRFEIRRKAGLTFVIDGAHNPSGAEALAAALKMFLRGRELTWLFGVFADKDRQGIIRRLGPLARRIVTVPAGGERGLEPFGLAETCRDLSPGVEILTRKTVEEGLAACYDLCPRGSVVCAAGSLRLAGEVRRVFRVA